MTEQVEVAAASASARVTPAARAVPAAHVLDRAPWESLTGHHARFAQWHGRAVRYDPTVATFVALEDESDPQAWEDVAELLGPDGRLVLPGVAEWPDSWKSVFQTEGVQIDRKSVV